MELSRRWRNQTAKAAAKFLLETLVDKEHIPKSPHPFRRLFPAPVWNFSIRYNYCALNLKFSQAKRSI
jgi:hypothetical protein